MADLLLTLSYEADSALPEDTSVNTLHFSGSNTTANVAGLATAVHTNWTAAIQAYMSSTLSGNVTYRAYDLADPKPRVPIIIQTSTITPATTSHPREVAAVLSYRAAQVSGANMARRRGRLYIGPISATASQWAVSDSDVRPTAATMTGLLAQFNIMYDACVALGYTLQVWSDVDGVGRTAVAAWMDNALDTQRRRGRAATTRTNQALT